MKKLLRKIKRTFTPLPTKEFSWSVEDFEAAKKWAKTQDDPDFPKQSLWEACYGNRNESSYVLAKINNHLRTLLHEKHI
tara:strand:+ start:297 stop:533 length:237 start_codon:yes stop_codon:yes gene_type:complete